jgi:hypothetical protein
MAHMNGPKAWPIAWQHPTEDDRWETDIAYSGEACDVLSRPLEMRGVPMFVRVSSGHIARVWLDTRRQEVMMEMA